MHTFTTAPIDQIKSPRFHIAQLLAIAKFVATPAANPAALKCQNEKRAERHFHYATQRVFAQLSTVGEVTNSVVVARRCHSPYVARLRSKNSTHPCIFRLLLIVAVPENSVKKSTPAEGFV